MLVMNRLSEAQNTTKFFGSMSCASPSTTSLLLLMLLLPSPLDRDVVIASVVAGFMLLLLSLLMFLGTVAAGDRQGRVRSQDGELTNSHMRFRYACISL